MPGYFLDRSSIYVSIYVSVFVYYMKMKQYVSRQIDQIIKIGYFKIRDGNSLMGQKEEETKNGKKEK